MTADASCCLTVAGSINSPYCKIMTDREMMMGKGKKGKKNKTPCSGKSILEMYWDELDTIMDRLMTNGAEAADGRDPGRAEGVAYCIAVMKNPYAPNIDSVRIEAVERFDLSNEIAGDPYDKHGEYPQQSDEM